MSIYNSSLSGANDNERTRKAKSRMTKIIKEQMATRGFKTWIKEEVPFTVVDEYKPICYHLDLGILFRKVDEFDFYHFFGCEIDDKGHQSDKHGRKDDERDDAFLVNKGIVTCRIPIDYIFSERGDETKLFDKWIWSNIVPSYIIMPIEGVKNQLWSELNRQFAIQLKENAFTKCSKCDHVAQQHDLTGCMFRLTNKSKMKCNCTNPYFRSDA